MTLKTASMYSRGTASWKRSDIEFTKMSRPFLVPRRQAREPFVGLLRPQFARALVPLARLIAVRGHRHRFQACQFGGIVGRRHPEGTGRQARLGGALEETPGGADVALLQMPCAERQQPLGTGLVLGGEIGCHPRRRR